MKRTKTFFAVLLTLLTILLLSFAVACGAPDEVTPGGDDNPGTVTPNPDDDPDDPDDPANPDDDPVNPDDPVTPAEKTFTVTVNEGENGSVTLSPEADGNQYKENTTVTVTVTPDEGYVIDSFTVSTDEDAALEDDGTYTLTVTADTTVSAAFKLHAHVQDSEKGLQHDATSHWYVCKVCGEKMGSTVANHSLKINAAKDKFECEQCGYSESHTHDLETKSAGAEGHKEVCKTEGCGYEGEVTSHSLKINAGKTAFVCEQCEYEEAHTHDTELQNAGAEGHKTVCKTDGCGYESAVTAHTAKDDEWQHDEGDETTGKHWQVCICGEKVNEAVHEQDGEPYGEKTGHYYKCKCGYTFPIEEHKNNSEKYDEPDNNGHSYYCDICDYKVTENHSWKLGTPDENGEHRICEKCGYDWRFALHSLKMVSDQNGTHHQECQNSNCTYKSDSVPCDMGWLPLENKAEGHSGACKTEGCGYKVESEPHDKSGVDGSCSKCGYKDFGQHVHEDKPDANGFYDGLCDEDGSQLDDPVWTFANGVITKYNGNYAKIKIPTEIGSVPVTKFDGNFAKNTTISDVLIPKGIAVSELEVASVGLFAGCSNLKSVIILAEVTTIGMFTFNDCTSLDWIVLPDTLKTISDLAFFGGVKETTLNKVYFMGTEQQWNMIKPDTWSAVDSLGEIDVLKDAQICYFKAEGGTAAANEWHWKVEGVIPKEWE